MIVGFALPLSSLLLSLLLSLLSTLERISRGGIP